MITTIKDVVNLESYKNLGKLLTEKKPKKPGSGSPHSNYNCRDLSTAVCGGDNHEK